MKKLLQLSIAVCAVTVLTHPVFAQTLRIDASVSRGGSFQTETEKRLQTERLFEGAFTSKWKNTETASLGPLSLAYLHTAGPGRLYFGATADYTSYKSSFKQFSHVYEDISKNTGIIAMLAGKGTASGSFENTSIMDHTVKPYTFYTLDGEIGYEYKFGSLTLTPKLGVRSYHKNFNLKIKGISLGEIDMKIVPILGPTRYLKQTLLLPINGDSNLEGDAFGSYLSLSGDYDIDPTWGVTLGITKSISPATGEATKKGGNGTIVSRMDHEVAFTQYQIGAKLKTSETFSFNFGIKKDTFEISYPNSFTVAFNIVALLMKDSKQPPIETSLDTVEGYLIEQHIHGAQQRDIRTSIYLGLTKNIDFK